MWFSPPLTTEESKGIELQQERFKNNHIGAFFQETKHYGIINYLFVYPVLLGLLESAVQDVYFLNNTVDFNDDCTEFVVSVFGQILHKQTDSDINKKDIVYVKIDSGLIFKIDRNNLAGYRFNPQKKEWNYDGPSFCEYEYGELRGKIIHFDDHYPVGEPYVYRSAQNGSPNKNKAEES